MQDTREFNFFSSRKSNLVATDVVSTTYKKVYKAMQQCKLQGQVSYSLSKMQSPKESNLAKLAWEFKQHDMVGSVN